MNIVTLLIQATALMLALIILRPLLKRYVSARIRCALWAIPAARLLFPFELKSSLSIMAPVESVADAVSKSVSQPIGIEPPTWLGSGIGMDTAPELPPPDALTAIPESGISLSSLLTVIWLLGAAVTAGIIIWQNIRFYKTVKRHSESLGDGFGLSVYLLRALPSPCLVGIIRPRIIVNAQTLVSDEVFEMTIHHEMTHYKRLDHIWGAVRGLLLVLFWFHPLVWLCSELFRSDCETACDAAATRGMDEDEKQSYGMALITLASRVPRGSTGRFVCLSTMSGSKKLLKERITALAKGRTFRTAAVIALILAAVMCFTMCTVPGEQGDTDVPPPSPTPGFMGEEPVNPAEPIPPEGVEKFSHEEPFAGAEGSLGDLAYYFELAAGTEFEDMDDSQFQSIISEYGELLKGSKFISRTSTDGQYAYIACLYQFQAPPLLHSMYSAFVSRAYEDNVQVLYTEDQADAFEQALATGDFPSDVYVIRNSSVAYHPDSNLILIEPVSAENSLSTIYSRYISGQRAYIFDALERGIALARPKHPYLEVYLISEKWGEICERIPLSYEEAEAILSEELTEIIPGFGFSAALYHDGSSELYSENTGIPQTVLDLAVEKCDYRFGDPGMINAPLTEAKLECSWLNEPLYADEADLERLGEILKNAQFGYVGACGYGAKLTVRMGNEMVTMFKGTDGCDTIVFGSYSGYFLGDKENEEFWEIFGMDIESKLPIAPDARLAYASTSCPMSEDDAQYIYNIISTGNWTSDSPACACDYSFYFDNKYYIYHSECGSIIDIENNKSLSIDAATMDKINDIIAQYTGT